MIRKLVLPFLPNKSREKVFIIFSKSVPCVPKRVLKLGSLFSLFVFKKIQIDFTFYFLLCILSNDSKIMVFESKLTKKIKDYYLTSTL